MTALANLSEVSQQDLLEMGLHDMAYVKFTEVEGREVFAVHAADGTEMGRMADRDVAFAAVRQRGLEPVSVH